jgi:RNA polymerase sigma-70 factor (ECF subfamily)
VLNKIEELSYHEISEVMDSSESAVDSLLQRAKKNLQVLLKDAFIGSDG